MAKGERRVRSSFGESSGVGSTVGGSIVEVTAAIVLAGLEEECQTELGVVRR